VVTADTCFLCHFKGLEHGRRTQVIGGCTGYHDAPKEKLHLVTGDFNHSDYVQRGVTCENCHSDAIKGDGEVPRQTCWNCHNQLTQVNRYDETQFVHETHVSKHKVECANCHIRIEHRLDAAAIGKVAGPHGVSLQGGGSCGQCHEQMHGGPLELYTGTGGRGVPDMPSPMARAQVDCIACHRTHQKSDAAADVQGQTYLGTQDRCNYCHGEKYPGRLQEWKQTIQTHQDKAEKAFALAKGVLEAKKLQGPDLLQAQRLLDDAEHNIRLVKLGHGVHNVNYATSLLNVAIENCQKVAAGSAGGAGAAGQGTVQ
jgi:ssDNA-binding Zn-finger/Zn-ribbon topoisomerase 1